MIIVNTIVTAMEAPPHDFASLAIIVTDWDVLYAKEKSPPTTPSPKVRYSPAVEVEPLENSKQIGISDVVDEIWSVMTNVLKSKLREACIGVLRRTDSFDASEDGYHLDDDARLLD